MGVHGCEWCRWEREDRLGTYRGGSQLEEVLVARPAVRQENYITEK